MIDRIMGSLDYSLVPRGKKRLKVLFTGDYDTAVVELDGGQIWTADSRSQLTRGQRIRLPDGSDLFVKLAQAYGSTELHLTRDGIPVPGSPTDPTERANQAGYLLLFFALVTALLGLAVETTDLDVVEEISLGWPSLLIALGYGALGVLTMRRIKAALLLGIGLFVVDTFAVVFLGDEAIGVAAIGVLFLRAILVVPLLRAVPAVETLARHKKTAANRAALDEAAQKAANRAAQKAAEKEQEQAAAEEEAPAEGTASPPG
ncbi:MAG: hypothetical protein U0359_12550 [Byssovorax sp.]